MDKQKHTVFIFDFGLARQIFLRDLKGNVKLREARKKVGDAPGAALRPPSEGRSLLFAERASAQDPGQT